MGLPTTQLRLLALVIAIAAFVSPVQSTEKTPQQIAQEGIASQQNSKKPITEAMLNQLLDGLAAESYQTRRESFVQLWQAGREALPAIQTAMTSKNALRADAAAMLEVLIRSNVSADKPDEAAEFIAELTNSPELALVNLCKRGFWSVAEELLESNDSLRETLTISSSAAVRLNDLVDEAIEQEDPTLAWPILRQVMPLPQAMWIAEKLNLEPPSFDANDTNNQAWAAVAQGDIQQALAGNAPPSIKATIAIRNFDWKALNQPTIQTSWLGGRKSVSRLTSGAVSLEFAGQLAESEKVWATVFPTAAMRAPRVNEKAEPDESRDAADKSDQEFAPEQGDGFNLMTDPALLVALESLQQDPTNLDRVLLCMLLTGRAQAVQDYLVKYDPDAAWSYCLARGDQQAAIRALGIEEDFANFDEWVEIRRDQLHKEVGNFFASPLNFRTTAQLANLLFALGKTAEADAVYEALVSVAQASRQSQSSCWSTLINSMSRAETRVRCLRIIRDNFSRMNEETRSVVFRSLYPELPTTAAMLHATAPEIAGDDGSSSKWAALEQLWRLNRSKFEPQSTKTLSAWLRRARNEMLEVDNLPADSLSELALLAQGLGLSDLAFEFTSDASQTASDRDSLAKLWTMAGSLLLERGQAEAAIRYLSAVRTLDGSRQEAIIDEANALNMSGKFDEATRLSNSRWLRPMNATIGPNSWFSVAKRATEAERFELAHEFIVPTMRYSGIDEEDNRSRQSLVYIALQYSEIADGLKDPQLSADVRRSLLLASLSPDSLSLPLSFHNSIAAKERLNRAILAAKANDMEAFERHALVAETLQPQGIELVEDTFHELIAVGQQAVAERLFAQFESRLLVHLEKWPQDATSHNNLAWMYARCDRKLDEALQHAETAVQISPNSAVLLDTLAEVYFRRKQYSQAITAMQRCIELDPRESHLRRQLTRFLEAAIE